MNIAITSITVNRLGNWTFSWAFLPLTTYRVVLYGTLLATSSVATYTYTGNDYPNFPPPIEVTISPDLALSELFSPLMYLQWYGEPAVDHYDIEQSLDSGVTWNLIDTIQESGQWIYTYQTTVQVDEQTYFYQVTAVDSIGNRSEPQQYLRYTVTPPVPPDGSIVVGYLNPFVIISASQ